MDGFTVGFVVSIFLGRITVSIAAAAAETLFFSVTFASRNKKK
jgi:hypothetical protein